MIDVHAAASGEPRPLGELLVSEGLLTHEQLAYALAQHAQTGRPIGDVLVTLGYVSGDNIARALATQQGGAAASEYGVAVAFGARTAGPAVMALPPTTGPAPQPAPAANEKDAGRAEIEELPVRIAELRGRTDEVAGLEQQLTEVVAEREALQIQLAAAARDAEQLRARVIDMEAERDARPPQHELDDRLATLESRLEDVVSMLGALGGGREAIDELEQRLHEKTQAYDELAAALERRQAEAHAAPVRDGLHFVFATVGATYELLEREGPVPQPGDTVEIGAAQHEVVRVSRMPGADRPTVYTTPR